MKWEGDVVAERGTEELGEVGAQARLDGLLDIVAVATTVSSSVLSWSTGAPAPGHLPLPHTPAAHIEAP